MTAETVLIIVALITAAAPIIVALRGLSKKADQIHILVNSNLTTVKADLEKANVQIKLLLEKLANQV